MVVSQDAAESAAAFDRASDLSDYLSQTSPWKVESNRLYRKTAEGTMETLDLESTGQAPWGPA